jgi:periplasmic protein CpxP/Spy
MPRIAFVLFPAVLLVAACGGPHRRGEVDLARAERVATERLDDLLDDVHATDAQRARIVAIKDRLAPEAKALALSQQQARQEMIVQLTSDRPDAARLHVLVDRQIDALRALAHRSVDGVVEAHATLTPEQRAPLAKKLRRYAAR